MVSLKNLAFLAANAVSVSAFWRMECQGRVGYGRVDPIVSPGVASSHAHTIHGSSGMLCLPCPSLVSALLRVSVEGRPLFRLQAPYSLHRACLLTSVVGFGLGAKYSDLMAGECTSCRVTQDRSTYWTPGVYFQDATTGEFELVPQVGGMLA